MKGYAVKCLTRVWNIKFNNVHCLASLVAGLISYQDDVGIKIVDDVLEEIRIGMEINHPKFNQRRISSVKFLGELYNYRMFDSSIVFNSLYSFITFGVTYDLHNISPIDPPENLFRIRLVCALLETCGQYFDRGTNKKKLDYFLQYFQRYIWFKKSHSVWQQTPNSASEDPDGDNTTQTKPYFSVEIDYLVQDTLEPLRPKLKLVGSLEEANKAVTEVENEIFAKLAEVAPKDNFRSLGDLPTKESDPVPMPQQTQSRGNLGLETIPEDHEIKGVKLGTSPATPTQGHGFPRSMECGSSQSGASDNDDFDSSDDAGSDREEENEEKEVDMESSNLEEEVKSSLSV